MRLALLAATVVCLSNPAARADVMGDTFHVTHVFGASVTEDFGNATVPFSLEEDGLYAITLNASSVTFTAYEFGTSVNFDPSTFNGFELTDLTKNPDVTGFQLVGDPLGGFSSANGSVSGNTLLFNFEGMELYYGSPVTFDFVSGAPSSVTPEPSSFALLGTGLFGVVGGIRRRFLKSA